MQTCCSQSGHGAQKLYSSRGDVAYVKGNGSVEATAILAYSAGQSPPVCRLFFPLFLFLSSWSLLFPLSAAFRSVLSSCQGNQSERSLSATTIFILFLTACSWEYTLLYQSTSPCLAIKAYVFPLKDFIFLFQKRIPNLSCLDLSFIVVQSLFLNQ